MSLVAPLGLEHSTVFPDDSIYSRTGDKCLHLPNTWAKICVSSEQHENHLQKPCHAPGELWETRGMSQAGPLLAHSSCWQLATTAGHRGHRDGFTACTDSSSWTASTQSSARAQPLACRSMASQARHQGIRALDGFVAPLTTESSSLVVTLVHHLIAADLISLRSMAVLLWKQSIQ